MTCTDPLCRSCAVVDRWIAAGNLTLRRPTARREQNDLAGVGAPRSRDDAALAGQPDVSPFPPRSASAG